MSGNCVPKTAASKSKLRIAPYQVKPYPFDAKVSCGAGPPKQVVVVGFDPFTPESQLKAFFSSYGEIDKLDNRTDPSTGSFLGICSVRYKDSRPVRGPAIPAAAAAKRAEKEGTGERIGLKTIRVERDREGRKCERHVQSVLRRAKEELEKEQSNDTPTPAVLPGNTPVAQTPVGDSPAPPPNAPKGPSGRAVAKPPEGPRAPVAPPRSAASLLVEEEPILSKIKRKPYIFIANHYVPVLGTTIPHLKKRLKAFDWREVRLDATGYYVVFEDSKRGEDETVRCFNECNMTPLFTYTMNMECQQYGNPEYERSPSPERAMAEKVKQEELERLQKEQDEDLEEEKRQRAEDLDPVLGALDQLKLELRNKIMEDIKARVVVPAVYECLDPARHVTKRRKLGLTDSGDIENKVPTFLLNKANDVAPATPRSRAGLSHSRPLRPHDPNAQRGRKAQTNAYIDERRRHRPAPKPHARPLHFQLRQMFGEDDDSDDERRTSLTRDTEDQESRPLSRASRTSTPFDTDSVDTPRHKRRKLDEDGSWDAEEEQDVFEDIHKQLLGHLLQKAPEDLATRELELVVNTLPRSMKFQKRARQELFIRQRAKYDDELFKTGAEDPETKSPFPLADGHTADHDAMDIDTKETQAKALPEKPKKKRKTKKQLQEEREALKEKVKEAAVQPVLDEKTIEHIEEKEAELEAAEEVEDEVPRPQVDWSVSTGKPRRTVDDDLDLALDIDGWQHLLKDDEDVYFLRKALGEEPVSTIGDAKLWVWKQKEIKTLNNGGLLGPVHSPAQIQGYYVPNPTGAARTEGIKKILNSEKSKYLPHHIKVQKAREERKAQAEKDPTAAAEAAKSAAAEKLATTASSRSNRANNRRLINDINLQKQNLNALGSETDAIRFNQLKKRKKLVKFDRSAIHGWGLYAEENIASNDLIIEYVGEKVRQKVADMREIRYTKQGIGSSYLFRMVDDEIVDATKKGGIARFINHSCTPNCTAKIIRVEGTRRIVIYALKDIAKSKPFAFLYMVLDMLTLFADEELTYDYKFEREYGSLDRIPCLCGSVGCKGFLN